MLSLLLYRLLVHAAVPVAVPAFWLRDRLTNKARPPFADRLLWRSGALDPGSLWIQAVSVGEVEVARRLLAELAPRLGDRRALLTATTATGLALAHSTLAERAVVRPCPLDLPLAVNRVFSAARPSALVLVETELWPEMIHQAKRRSVPVAVVNGRLSEASFRRYHRLRALLAPRLAPLSLVAVRSEADGERFAALGIARARITVTGNIKYDMEPDTAPLEWAEGLQHLAGERPVVVAGSTMEGEEEVVAEAVQRLRSAGRPVFLVLAPRHPERFDTVARLLADRGLPVRRRSDQHHGGGAADVFLIDTIGELARAYGLGRVAFVGGSLVATGGHNPLEPACWGVPVLTGPQVFNFREVYAEMHTAGAALTVSDASSLSDALQRWLLDPAAAAAAGARGRSVVEANRGATARTVEALNTVFDRGTG